MPVNAATLRRLAGLALSPEAMAGVLEIIADMQEHDERRKEAQRDRKRRSRDCPVTVTAKERDRDVNIPPDKERSPVPPKEINPLPSLRSVHTAREIEDAQFAEFWLAYPNKVGKPKARTSFVKALKRDEFEVIMDGLRRYVRTRPPDRDWLNPATFLNQERWNDEPAAVTQRSSLAGPSRQQSILDGMAEAVERRRRLGGWEAEADARRRGDGGTGPPDRGGDFEDRGELAGGAG